MLLSIYNESRYAPTLNQVMTIEALPEEKRPAACIACGQCSRMCPQGIEIPQVLQNLDFTLKSLPSWDEICRQREKAKKT